MMTPYPPYKAPRLEPALVQLYNRLCSRCPRWTVPFGTGQASGELLDIAPSFTAAAVLELRFGEAGWKGYLSDISCILRHPAFSAEGGSFELEALPQEVQKAVLASQLAPSFSRIQEATGRSLSIIDISLTPADFPSVGIGFKLRLSDESSRGEQTVFFLLAPAEPKSAAEAAEMLKPLPLRANPALADAVASVPLEMTLETGYLFLKVEELASLQPEDMLLPEAWLLSQGQASLRIYHGSSAVLTGGCALRDGSAVLETPLAEEVGTSMETDKDIEIRLSFELDRRLVTVGELSSIAPGFTFPMTGSADSIVTVRANGKAIARGRLVDMNGTIGVQVTETL